MDIEMLPKLVYFGDVSVENYMHGSTLLYRLLSAYPKDKLLVVEGTSKSNPERRIDGIVYHRCSATWHRLLSTRLHRYVSPIATLSSPLQRIDLSKVVRNYRPKAVLTVVWNYGWAAAASYAERAGLPFHLIIHDDPMHAEAWSALERRIIDQRLRRWYPKAASRLCVSPYMAEEYRRQFGAKADVLYPSRAPDAPVFREPSDTLRRPCAPFTVAFAGSIYLEYARALQRVATALRRSGGRLIVYGPWPPESVVRLLEEPNIELRGRVSSGELIWRCREEAHAMFIPMSYREQDRLYMEISFPSKLTDSTAVGLPLIIDGPEYCSAVRWARENPGVAEIITDQTIDSLAASLARLQDDPAHRDRLARQAIYRGHQYFAPQRAISLLYAKLTGCDRTAEP